jgi:hypothetical protein
MLLLQHESSNSTEVIHTLRNNQWFDHTISHTIEYILVEDVPFALPDEHGELRPTVLSSQEADASWRDV